MLLTIEKQRCPWTSTRPWYLFVGGKVYDHYRSKKSALDNLDACLGDKMNVVSVVPGRVEIVVKGSKND